MQRRAPATATIATPGVTYVAELMLHDDGTFELAFVGDDAPEPLHKALAMFAKLTARAAPPARQSSSGALRRTAPTSGNRGRATDQRLVATHRGCVSLLPLDTSPEAHEAQLRSLRRLTPSQRVDLAAQMSEDVRTIARAGISARHPEYTATEVHFALLRMLYGDDLFRRAWPNAPLLAS
jgi:hypothetical protein